MNHLVQYSQLPTFVSPMVKGVINETYSNFAGVYADDGFFDSVRRYIEGSDLVLSIGAIKSDFNTTCIVPRHHIPKEKLKYFCRLYISNLPTNIY